MAVFEDVVKQVGFLTDRNILAALTSNCLLEKGSWRPENLRHASYTLRLGDRVHLCRASSGTTAQTKEFTVVQLTQAEPRVEIRPGETALLYSMEVLRFPDCVLGFTVARGLLFAEGLSPENTYVDPGFTGTIYTTITNVTSRVIQLEYGMDISRLFFFRLTEPVQDGYRTGSALGIAQQLKSVRATPNSTADECRQATDQDLLESVKLIPIGGQQAAESMSRLSERQLTAYRRLLVLATTWPPLLVFANSSDWMKENLGGFAANVAASLVATALLFVAPRVFSWVTRGRSK